MIALISVCCLLSSISSEWKLSSGLTLTGWGVSFTKCANSGKLKTAK